MTDTTIQAVPPCMDLSEFPLKEDYFEGNRSQNILYTMHYALSNVIIRDKKFAKVNHYYVLISSVTRRYRSDVCLRLTVRTDLTDVTLFSEDTYGDDEEDENQDEEDEEKDEDEDEDEDI